MDCVFEKKESSPKLVRIRLRLEKKWVFVSAYQLKKKQEVRNTFWHSLAKRLEDLRNNEKKKLDIE